MKRILLILLLLAVAAGGWWYYAKAHPDEVEYETAPVTRGDITQIVTATGILNPVKNVQVGSQISGNISKLFVDYNSPVKEGEIVAQLDPSIYQAIVHQSEGDLASSKAAFSLAQLTAKRKMELVDQHAAPQADLDTANAALHQAEAAVQMKQANLEKAKVDLDHCTIYSPIDGTVISRAVDVGQTVAAVMNAPVLFTVANDLAKMQIDSSVAEADVGNCREGEDVEFSVDAFPYRTFHGKVEQVRNAPTTVQNVVTYDVVVSVANDELLLKPGMTANISIIVEKRKGALKLPNAALRFHPLLATATPASIPAASSSDRRPGERPAPERGGDRPPGEHGEHGGHHHKPEGDGSSERTIYVMRSGTADPQPVRVQLGISDGITSEILSGLAENDAVATAVNQPNKSAASDPSKSNNPLSGRTHFH